MGSSTLQIGESVYVAPDGVRPSAVTLQSFTTPTIPAAPGLKGCQNLDVGTTIKVIDLAPDLDGKPEWIRSEIRKTLRGQVPVEVEVTTNRGSFEGFCGADNIKELPQERRSGKAMSGTRGKKLIDSLSLVANGENPNIECRATDSVDLIMDTAIPCMETLEYGDNGVPSSDARRIIFKYGYLKSQAEQYGRKTIALMKPGSKIKKTLRTLWAQIVS
jgi:hypothetical protein